MSTTDGKCDYGTSYRDFDGTAAFARCASDGVQATLLDGTYESWMREHEPEAAAEFAPYRFVTCADHHAALLSEIEGQEEGDPYRGWIVGEGIGLAHPEALRIFRAIVHEVVELHDPCGCRWGPDGIEKRFECLACHEQEMRVREQDYDEIAAPDGLERV